MDKIQKLKQQKQYEDYVKKKTPRHNVFLDMFKAFLLGGTICLLGQVIFHYCEMQGLSAEECSSWDFPPPCSFQCSPHRNRYLSPACEMGRCRSARSHHRIRQLCGSAGDRVQEGGTGIRDRMQDLHHRRTGDPVRDLYKLGTGVSVLDLDVGEITHRESCRFCNYRQPFSFYPR